MSGGPTGDEYVDRFVGPAMRLAGGVRMWSQEEVDGALFDAAIHTDGDLLAAARGLAIVCAAMVPWEATPGALLHWVSREPEFRRLVDAGVDEAVAADICAGLTTAATPHPQTEEG